MTIADPSSHPDPNRLQWVHVKSGTYYEVLHHAVRESDLTPMVVYRKADATGPIWIRTADEFYDGRFVPNRTYLEYSGQTTIQDFPLPLDEFKIKDTASAGKTD